VDSFLYKSGVQLDLTSTPFSFDSTTNELIVNTGSETHNGVHTFTFRQKPDYDNENVVFFFYIFDLTVSGTEVVVPPPVVVFPVYVPGEMLYA